MAMLLLKNGVGGNMHSAKTASPMAALAYVSNRAILP